MTLEFHRDVLPDLIMKYLMGDLTDEEVRLLDEWKNASELNLLLFNELTNAEALQAYLRDFSAYNTEEARQKICSQLGI